MGCGHFSDTSGDSLSLSSQASAYSFDKFDVTFARFLFRSSDGGLFLDSFDHFSDFSDHFGAFDNTSFDSLDLLSYGSSDSFESSLVFSDSLYQTFSDSSRCSFHFFGEDSDSSLVRSADSSHFLCDGFFVLSKDGDDHSFFFFDLFDQTSQSFLGCSSSSQADHLVDEFFDDHSVSGNSSSCNSGAFADFFGNSSANSEFSFSVVSSFGKSSSSVVSSLSMSSGDLSFSEDSFDVSLYFSNGFARYFHCSSELSICSADDFLVGSDLFVETSHQSSSLSCSVATVLQFSDDSFLFSDESVHSLHCMSSMFLHDSADCFSFSSDFLYQTSFDSSCMSSSFSGDCFQASNISFYDSGMFSQCNSMYFVASVDMSNNTRSVYS